MGAAGMAASGGAAFAADDLKAQARDAWLYALPLIEIAQVRQRGAGFGMKLNTFFHNRNLADHRARTVTTPNNDTLYASGQIDLSAGPVTLTLPGAGERYISLQLMDAYSNSFAVPGTRTTGPDAITIRLVGPNEAAGGESVIRSPTNHVWALARVLVDGPHDLEAARAVLGGVSMQGPAVEHRIGFADRRADWRAYFDSAHELMKLNPPPVTDQALLRRCGFLLARGYETARLTAEAEAEIEAGIAEARQLVRGGGVTGGARPIDGWSYPPSNLGDFGQSYGFRAAVALGGLAALPPAEAMYMRAVGENRGVFDGSKAWKLHFPADRLIPVDSFWSLSLYEATPEGQYFFADNPLDRYAIGDRSPGLKINDDGSLDLWIGHGSPGADREGNWLPAPAGAFALFMRAYLPKPELLNGQYRLPPVEAA